MIIDPNLHSTLQHLRVLVSNSDLVDEGIVATLKQLTAELNVQVHPMRYWSWNYLHQVYREKIIPSKILCRAINRLSLELTKGAQYLRRRH